MSLNPRWAEPQESWLPAISPHIAWLVDRHVYAGVMDVRWEEVSAWIVDEGVPLSCRVCRADRQVSLRRHSLVGLAGIYLAQCPRCRTVYFRLDPVRR